MFSSPRLFGFAIALAVAGTGFARDQTAAHLPQIGVVDNSVPVSEFVGPRPSSPLARALLDGLRERGWIDGRNVKIHWRSAEDDYARRPAFIEELLRIPVDVIVVEGNFAIGEAREKTKTVPIVALHMNTENAIENGYVESPARPGRNVTGLGWRPGDGLHGKNLALLKQIAPKASRVAVPVPWYYIDQPSVGPNDAPGAWGVLEEAARAIGLTIMFQRFESVARIESAAEEAVRRGADAFYVYNFAPFARAENRSAVQRVAERRAIPALYVLHGASDSGGLVTHSIDEPARWRRGAYYVDKLLSGAKAADLPIEEPTSFELVVNLKAAKAIGLEIPKGVLLQADRIVQ